MSQKIFRVYKKLSDGEIERNIDESLNQISRISNIGIKDTGKKMLANNKSQTSHLSNDLSLE